MAVALENAPLFRQHSLPRDLASSARKRVESLAFSGNATPPSAPCLAPRVQFRLRRQQGTRPGTVTSARRDRARGTVKCSSTSTSAVASTSTAGVESLFHELPSKLRLEVLVQRANKVMDDGEAGNPPLPPLLFVHGSYHAAWCWREHWMPYFASQGHDCYAVSLLGQGKSDTPSEPVAGTIQSHARALSHLISNVIGVPPVMVGHSFGGLIVQAYLSLKYPKNTSPEDLAPLAGSVLLCSVPPSGNKDLVMRFLVTRPILSIKVTLSLAAKMFATNTGLCKESFFSPDMPDSDVVRYQALLAESSRLPLFDLRKLNASLPVPKPDLDIVPPLFILGAENDAVLDIPALQETSDFFESPFSVVPNIAHDVMIDTRWEDAAKELHSWLRR